MLLTFSYQKNQKHSHLFEREIAHNNRLYLINGIYEQSENIRAQLTRLARALSKVTDHVTRAR